LASDESGSDARPRRTQVALRPSRRFAQIFPKVADLECSIGLDHRYDACGRKVSASATTRALLQGRPTATLLLVKANSRQVSEASRSRPPPGAKSAALDERWWQSLAKPDRRRLSAYRPIIEEIAAFGAVIEREPDERLFRRAARLRRRATGDTRLEDLLPETFALTREIAHRVLDERPYDPQILAGIALHEGRLAEMKTGEGKTLAAVAPVALNALTGGGVHVMTFNDYLARRDARWMKPVYERLGLSVASIGEATSADQRRAAYRADITYLTVKEAGFDLLRDGLCLDPGEQVQRPPHFALVDEADSILIDEAKVPLVIAGGVVGEKSDLAPLARIARMLEPSLHFDTDEEKRNIFLTEEGTAWVESHLGCGNLFDRVNLRLQAEIRNALHAEHLLERDVDYIVREGRIELVDELTGRVADRRHWPDGLQAALEMKEGLELRPEGSVLGSITVQDFILRYPRRAAMSATANSAARELREIYDLEIIEIPTYRTCIRSDHPDLVFTTRQARETALLGEIDREHARRRPILVGTRSVMESEHLAGALRRRGLSCRVLNARNDAQEAAIIADAGAPGAITISTNMAGRGTDIRLGGANETDRDSVHRSGGLHVIGTNRHDSRRIDDQLRGRAGRQGDPGSSRFLISLEDDLLERCGIERLIPGKLLPDGDILEPISHPAVLREVDRAQRILEGQHGDIRSRLLRYSELVESQRRQFQARRRAVLNGLTSSRILAERCPEIWQARQSEVGEPLLLEVEQRLTLLMMDRFWREHLDLTARLKEGIHLVQYDGRSPLVEFYRIAGAAWNEMFEAVDRAIVKSFGRLDIGPDGVDWESARLRGPSSTWTYLVNDSVVGENTFMALANRPSLGFAAVLACWWLLIPWALALHWRRWRARLHDRRGKARL
jgi:preprotein translocase subunit SecA